MPRGALWLRIAPNVPSHLLVDETRLRPFLMRVAALVAVAPGSSGICIDVGCIAPDQETTAVRLRFEIRHADSLPSGWRELGASAGISMLPEGAVPWIEIPAETVPEFSTGTEIGRVIAVGQEDEPIAGYLSLFRQRGIQCIQCQDAADALQVFSQPSIGIPVRALLLEERDTPFAKQHEIREALIDRARTSGVPAYVVARGPLDDGKLRHEGITGQLPPPSMQSVSNILAMAPELSAGGGENVVHVPSWRWREQVSRLPVILVADDVEAVRLVLARVLESLGYVAHTARSGEEALTRLLDESVHRYQAAILDISMPPGISGPEVIRRYRQRRPHSRLPIIVLTANDSRESQILAADAGADAFLSKPVSAESLRATLGQLLSVDIGESDSDETDLVRELPTIDWAVLAEIEKLYTSESEVARLIAAFSADAGKQVAEIGRAAANRDQAGVRNAAQALKSLAAGVGASRLAEAARQVEELPGLPAKQTLTPTLERLQSNLVDVIAMLSGLRR